jgi:RimJ/RimL family protein N-acetyltransferase
MLDLVLAEPPGGEYLGEVVLLRRAQLVGELAYVVAPAARGRGLAGEAVRVLSEWAFEELGLARLELRIEPANTASHRVAEKAGFQREGLLRSAFVLRGRRTDVFLYSRLPTD